MTTRGLTLTERFSLHYFKEPNSGCWLWTGAAGGENDYGSFNDGKRTSCAHRVSWEISRGPIPPGLLVLHKCDTPLCVNPDHLFLGDSIDNGRDMAAKGRQIFQRHPERASRGERHGLSKLTSAQIPAILRDQRTLEEIAADYGVGYTTIQKIKSRHTWRHIHTTQP